MGRLLDIVSRPPQCAKSAESAERPLGADLTALTAQANSPETTSPADATSGAVTVAPVATVAVVEGPEPRTELSPAEESSIRAWLAHIEETDPVGIAEVLSKCRNDMDARRYFLKRSEEVPKTSVPCVVPDADHVEALEERAAILEYDARLPREKAERRARAMYEATPPFASDVDFDRQLTEALTEACQGLAISPAEVRAALAPEDIVAWRSGDLPHATLRDFARSLEKGRGAEQSARAELYERILGHEAKAIATLKPEHIAEAVRVGLLPEELATGEFVVLAYRNGGAQGLMTIPADRYDGLRVLEIFDLEAGQ
jgi:hypothetical protein